jgi:DNA-binding NtrC family response regulator
MSMFLKKLNDEHSRTVKGFSPSSLESLERYDWPGNVRELRNVLESIVVLSRKETIDLESLPTEIQTTERQATGPRPAPGISLSELERRAIQDCLLQTGGNRQMAARALGISSRTLLRKIRKYELRDPLHSGPVKARLHRGPEDHDGERHHARRLHDS